MENFKSFRGHHVIPFALYGVNCITGANGSGASGLRVFESKKTDGNVGKSNLIGTLPFCHPVVGY